MSTYYLIRLTERDINFDEEERLHSIDSKSDALNFTVDAMKDSDCKILNIIQVEFKLYGNIMYTPLELTIVHGKFELTSIAEDEK